MKKLAHYSIGILIAVFFYVISMFWGSIINVIIVRLNGYDNYTDFALSGKTGALIILTIHTLVNHFFMAWLSVKIMARYARKHSCTGVSFYYIAAAAVVVFLLIVFNIVLSQTSGWLPIVSHSAAITVFGKRSVKRMVNEPTYKTSYDDNTIDRDDVRFCSQCGAKLEENSRFCHKCGVKVR